MLICGPKLSLCGIVISIWGIIQLFVMGLFYYVHSVAMIEDLAIAKEQDWKNTTLQEFYDMVNRAFSQSAYNCWFAASLYLLTLLIFGQQFYANKRITTVKL